MNYVEEFFAKTSTNLDIALYAGVLIIGYVLYENGIIGTSDSVRAFIVNPQDQSEILHQEKILLQSYFIDDNTLVRRKTVQMNNL